jgi:hypothetical protein
MLITPLPLNTRHAGPRQVAVGPGALRQLICDTTKVNTGAAETTYTDTHITVLHAETARLRAEIASPFLPRPLRDRLTQRADSLQQIADRHARTRVTGQAADDQ